MLEGLLCRVEGVEFRVQGSEFTGSARGSVFNDGDSYHVAYTSDTTVDKKTLQDFRRLEYHDSQGIGYRERSDL